MKRLRWQWHSILADHSWQRLCDLLLIVVSLVGVTILHYTTSPESMKIHNLHRFLYLLPITYAGLRFGLWVGFSSALLANLAFLPHILSRWQPFWTDVINDTLVALVMCGVGILTGVMTNRLRQAHDRQARTAQELAASLQRLEHQGEELRRAERLSALGSLAGGLAHEIRNPMGIIRATAQLLEVEYGPDAVRPAAIIRQEADRVEQLVQKLLSYAGDDAPERRPADVNKLLARVVERLAPLAAAHGIDLQVRAPALPFVELDAEQMEQVLLNLGMNAIQALDGPGEVRLAADLVEGERGMLQIQVRDNGPGIPPEIRAHIFDPFYTTKEGGTGMGLSIVQRIVEDHGGRVWVESTPGQGTIFTVQLPLREEG